MERVEAKWAPVSTYRLQLHRNFTFDAVRKCVDYLSRLGITDCYLSPILEAREGSLHGYDVVDPGEVRRELGGESALLRCRDELRRRGMGILLDTVPNHMCVVGGQNRWWDDVLRRGRNSAYARFFDIDWRASRPGEREAKIVLPCLTTSLREAVETRSIALIRADGEFSFDCNGQRFPIALGSWRAILRPAVQRLERMKRAHASDLRALLEDLPELQSSGESSAPHDDLAVNDDDLEDARREPTASHRERFRRLIRLSPDVREAVDARVAELNGHPTELREMLAEQHYVLQDWRKAGESINYRRFFDISELAAVRVEDPAVFRATHEKILELVARNVVTGLRVDHVDGLQDPKGYLTALPDDCFIVVEKILESAERLRADWPVEGTTGYEFLNALNGIFVDSSCGSRFRERYAKFTGRDESFDDVLYRSKKLMIATSFTRDLRRLAGLLAESGLPSLARSPEHLAVALTEIAACFPVYRTYVGPVDETVSAEDRTSILTAVARAKDRSPRELAPLLDAIGELLQLAGPTTKARATEFVLRFQQFTSAVMPKGFEDTALYRYYPLASLNDVGSDPDRFGVDLDDFHRLNADRREHWPHGLSATSTHDIKRDEDVRARLNVLSGVPDRWWDTVSRWRRLNGEIRDTNLDPNDEYLLYQTIVGAWPAELPNEGVYEELVGRIQAFMQKALREGKVHSSWLQPNEAYERELADFVAAILDVSEGAPFLESLSSFLGTILEAGFLNAVSQLLLKIGSPGVPDFYQGTELWKYALVDPDNRRDVDFERRRRALEDIDASVEREGCRFVVERLLRELADGQLKLYVTSRALRFRRANRELFQAGDYVPLRGSGRHRDHVVAFARVRDHRTAIFAAARFFTRLPAPPTRTAWLDSRLELDELQAQAFREVLTEREVRSQEGSLPLEEVFADLPFVLLESVG